MTQAKTSGKQGHPAPKNHPWKRTDNIPRSKHKDAKKKATERDAKIGIYMLPNLIRLNYEIVKMFNDMDKTSTLNEDMLTLQKQLLNVIELHNIP